MANVASLRNGLAAGLLLLVPQLQAEEMRLLDLVQAVREQGHAVLYSSDLVHRGMLVDVDEASLQSLREVLPEFGLTLEREGETWLIRAGGSPVALPSQERRDDPPEAPRLETMIVTGTRHVFPQLSGAASGRRISAGSLASTPALASDPARAMLRVPGVSSVGISAKPHIRGGLKDELLILQDGIELIEPFHLADYHSAYSALDYHTVESVAFYTGGFPPRYGNRMSGVMDISNAWLDREYDTSIGLSSFAAFIDSRHALPVTTDGFWSFAYRQGDLSDLTDYVETRSGEPAYRDGSLRLGGLLAPGLRLDGGLAYTEDDIVFEDTGELASSQIDSWYGWLRVDKVFSESLQSSISLSLVDFQRRKRLANAELEDDPEAETSSLDYRQDVQRFNLRNDFRWLEAGVFHEFGWQLYHNEARYDNVSIIDRGDLADIIGTVRFVERDIQLSPEGWSGGAYWAGDWSLGKGWHVQPGLRWDWQSYYLESGTEHQLAPRLGIAWDLDEQTMLRLSIGRFYQPEGIQELQVLDGIERFYEPQRSNQAVFGLEHQRDRWRLVLEAYYKDYKNPKGRFENVFNPFVLLPEMESDRLGLLPDEATACGVDLDFELELRPGLMTQFRYSYMQAQDRLEGRRVDRRWSQQHTVNAGITWQRDAFSVSAALLWHSGWRSTLLPGFVPEDEPVNILAYLNNVELREHFTIDISARYRWEFPRARVEVFADIGNVTDRLNQAGIDFDEEEVEGGYELEPDQETLLGRIPSIGIIVSF